MEVVMPLSVSTQLAKNEVKNTVSKIKESCSGWNLFGSPRRDTE